MFARIKELESVTKELTLLYVEDDEMTRSLGKRKLEKHFASVWIAQDGEEGLELFAKGGIDLIITDNIMPRLDGISMIRKIRENDSNIPIIITTAFIDIDYLVEAINLGVTQFVTKPISMDKLFLAIETAVQRVVLDNLTRRAKEQEIELLRFQDRYHSSQQEQALKKELNIIRNDFFLKAIHGSDEGRWLIDLLYKPLETLSGDSYSIRDIGDSRVMLFLLDGMGKGLSASVTTTLSVAFLNHIIDKKIQCAAYDDFLQSTILEYLDFITKELLEEEMISAGFYLIDFNHSLIHYATFSMPAILGIYADQSVLRLKSNNEPIIRQTHRCAIDSFSIDAIEKLVIFSDGLNESRVGEHGLYGEYLTQDLLNAPFITTLLDRFKEKVSEMDDDLTLFFVRKVPKNTLCGKQFSILGSKEAIDQAGETAEAYLEENGLNDPLFVNRYLLVLHELLMNAFEHGSLGVDRFGKDAMIQDDCYDAYLAKSACEKQISITLCIIEDRCGQILSTTIKDQGKGFDTRDIERYGIKGSSTLANGRGIMLSKSIADEITFSDHGSSVEFMMLIDQQP